MNGRAIGQANVREYRCSLDVFFKHDFVPHIWPMYIQGRHLGFQASEFGPEHIPCRGYPWCNPGTHGKWTWCKFDPRNDYWNPASVELHWGCPDLHPIPFCGSGEDLEWKLGGSKSRKGPDQAEAEGSEGKGTARGVVRGCKGLFPTLGFILSLLSERNRRILVVPCDEIWT